MTIISRAELEVKLTTILMLNPESAEQLHPFAVKWFGDLSAAIEKQLAIDGLTVDDIETFLSDDEKRILRRQKSGIEVALLTCAKPHTAYSGPPPGSDFGPDFLMMQLGTFVHVENIKSLLRRIHSRKSATVSEAMRKRDEFERRTRALQALNPPMALARKYLTGADEYMRFEMSISGAVDAYLELGELYGSHKKAKEYGQCMKMIEDRQREEAGKQRAQLAADAYNRRLNEEIRELTSQLCRREKNLSRYFAGMVRDKRYSGHSFDYVLSEEQKKEMDVILINIANKQLEQLCSEDLRQFTVLPFKYRRCYYPLPTASYSFEDIPCLDFSFGIFAAICIEIWLRPGKKSFDGFEFPLPYVEGKNGLSLLDSPKFLGYYYCIFKPEELKAHLFWKRIPLVILNGLFNGETRPEGTTISAASDEGITYRVPKLEDEITIPTAFAAYLRGVGTIDEMVSMHILAGTVADIVKSELIGPTKTCEASSSKKRVARQDTKKAMLNPLFDRGKRPGDPEVRSLNIKPNTVYRYFQHWKRNRNHL